jgi:protein-tyrosine phosphatase
MKKQSVLFVCLGNICRSPLGEGIFREEIARRGLSDAFVVDSCGTSSYHQGDLPHPESRQVAEDNGISLKGQRSRALVDSDYERFDTMIAMDRENLRGIRSHRKSSSVNSFCLREFDKKSNGDLDVPDPYYVGGFQGVYDIIERSVKCYLDELLSEEN